MVQPWSTADWLASDASGTSMQVDAARGVTTTFTEGDVKQAPGSKRSSDSIDSIILPEPIESYSLLRICTKAEQKSIGQKQS